MILVRYHLNFLTLGLIELILKTKEKWVDISDLEQSKPLHTKLKELKSHLKLWYAHIKDVEANRKNCILATLRDLDKKINRMQELKDLEKLESMDLVQKSRVKWEIVAKILANRLSKVIDSIISPEQSTFITRRQILDGPLILSETIDWYTKHKKKMMLFKVDFEKAFDFGLHMALNDGLAANIFHGIKVGSSVRVSSNEEEIMASYTGCEAGFFPFTYLGLPIGSNMSHTANLQPLIDRLRLDYHLEGQPSLYWWTSYSHQICAR
ncbi:RNA-directed DNA polymerase, eukaryota, reverse transcriptase zinc-binding domain protein, partial [Tanacetum coccineum]